MLRLLALVVLATALAAGCGGSEEAAEPVVPETTEAPLATTETLEAETGAPTTAPPETEVAAPVECTEEEFPSQGVDHVTEAPAGFEYSSFPPTSGPHHPDPAPWSLYSEPVPQLHLIHNLEHGGVVVQFGTEVPEAAIGEIVQWYLDSPDGIVVAPLPELGGKVALSAWQHLLTCDGFDEAAFTAFRDEYRFHGPEELPPELMKPLGV